MIGKAFFLFPLPLSLLLACSPSSQERKEMVQCSSSLKQTLLDIQIGILGEPSPSTNSATLALDNMKYCPVTGVPYVINPDLKKWITSHGNGEEVAIYCPGPHYKALGQTRYAAVTFAGGLVRLTNEPSWNKLKATSGN